MIVACRAYWFPIVITVIPVILALAGDSTTELLRYQRGSILAGEPWRIFTAHFVHLSWNHLFLNLAGYLLVLFYSFRFVSVWLWLVTLVVCVLSVGFGLYWISPQVGWYVGLSGILHGLLLLAVLLHIKAGDRVSILLLLLVVAKLAWEQLVGPLPEDSISLGGSVIVDAHLYGAIGGLLMGLIVIFFVGAASPPRLPPITKNLSE